MHLQPRPIRELRPRLLDAQPLPRPHPVADLHKTVVTQINTPVGELPANELTAVPTGSTRCVINLSCWRSGGTTHAGHYGTTSVWDRLTDGTWVTDAFIYSGMVLVGPSC